MLRAEYISEVEFVNIFADNLRDIMNEVGINQRELAEVANLTEATVSRYLNKRRIPDLKSLVNICYVLECELSDLIPTYALID